jgi:antitoxin (DNA-binding transcriptional repressor) of toxin-antitoxin stability system
MPTMTIEEAQARLPEVIDQLPPGEELVLTRDAKPVATIKATRAPHRESPRLGTLKGTIWHITPDFDAIPEGFEEYLS